MRVGIGVEVGTGVPVGSSAGVGVMVVGAGAAGVGVAVGSTVAVGGGAARRSNKPCATHPTPHATPPRTITTTTNIKMSDRLSFDIALRALFVQGA